MFLQIFSQQLDCTTAALAAELEYDRLVSLSAQHQTNLTSVESVARDATEQRQRLSQELVRVTAERDAGRATLDELHRAHEERLAQLQRRLNAIEEAARAQQQKTSLAQQHMSNLARERREMESRHDLRVAQLMTESKALDVDHMDYLQTHEQWLERTVEDQRAQQARLKALNDKIEAAMVETAEMDTTLAQAIEKRRLEQEKVNQLEKKVEEAKHSNVALR